MLDYNKKSNENGDNATFQAFNTRLIIDKIDASGISAVALYGDHVYVGDVIHVAYIDEAYGSYVDDEDFDNHVHDDDDDTDDDTDNNTGDDTDDDIYTNIIIFSV